MKNDLSRRHFIATSAGLAAGCAAGLASSLGLDAVSRSRAALAEEPSGFATKLHKSWLVGKPTEGDLKRIRDAGFEGVEAGIVGEKEAEECRAIAEKLGMRIHSVLRGWAEFNSPDKGKVEATLADTEKAILAAKGYGADAVLLVPCRVGGLKMPLAWEWQIDYDEETGHVRKVAFGDNTPYADYIAAHNQSTDASREAVKRLIPLAEKSKVVIALENVWNNLWVRPAIFRNFVASFKSPWVKAYFDIGNHVKYEAPEEWILTLGGLLAKIHVKDFRLNPADPRGEGTFVHIRDGSVRWPVVRTALDRVGYNGWMTIEDSEEVPLAEQAKRLDLIIAGK